MHVSEIATAVERFFAGTPAGQALAAEKEANRLADRRAVRSDLDKAEALHAKRLPNLTSELTAREAELERARGAYEDAQRRRRDALFELTGAGDTFERSRQVAAAALRASADPAIAAFVEELHQLDSDTCRGINRIVQAKRDPYSEKLFAVADTNYPSVVACVAAIRAARQAALDLQLEVDVDVRARLEELRESIPGIEFVRVTGGSELVA